MKNKAYKVVMSRGEDIPIDADEVDGLLEAISNGSVHAVRRGVINPSFFVSIKRDDDRMDKYYDDKKYAEGEELNRLKRNGVEKLDSIFSGTSAIQSIQANDESENKNLIEN